MSGELDLRTLLSSMRPELTEDAYVFATVEEGSWPEGLRPRMVFREAEGTTLVLLRSEAEAAGIAYAFPCRMITLTVHSALEAVGFIAAVAARLARVGMGVNPVAGFYHDHLFVPEDRAEDAMAALNELAANSDIGD